MELNDQEQSRDENLKLSAWCHIGSVLAISEVGDRQRLLIAGDLYNSLTQFVVLPTVLFGRVVLHRRRRYIIHAGWIHLCAFIAAV